MSWSAGELGVKLGVGLAVQRFEEEGPRLAATLARTISVRVVCGLLWLVKRFDLGRVERGGG